METSFWENRTTSKEMMIKDELEELQKRLGIENLETSVSAQLLTQCNSLGPKCDWFSLKENIKKL